MSRRVLCSIAMALFVATTSFSVLAADDVNPAALKTFEEGRALADANDFASAKTKFRASLDIQPTVGALLNLGECHEKLGERALAYRRFRQAESLARSKNDGTRETFARGRADALKSSVGFAKVVFAAPPAQNQHPHVSLEVDGSSEALPDKIESGEMIALESGEHRLTVTAAAGGAPFETTARVRAGNFDAPTVVNVEWTASKKTASQPPSSSSTSDTPPSTGGSSLVVPAIVVGGTGIAALIVGGVLGGMTLSKKSDLEDLCPSYPTCPGSARTRAIEIDSDASSLGAASTITLIAGAVLVATGVGLYLFFGNDPPEKQRAAIRRSVRSVGAGGFTF